MLLIISVIHYRFNAWYIIFIFYFFGTSFGPIEYRGPMSAVYIEKFVRRVMKPLLYISSQSELLDFLSNYEVPVFHISFHSQGFTGLYWIACIRKVFIPPVLQQLKDHIIDKPQLNVFLKKQHIFY